MKNFKNKPYIIVSAIFVIIFRRKGKSMFEAQSPDTIKRVPYQGHPNQCQQIIGGRSQCCNLAVEGGVKCICHGGHKELESQRSKSLRIFRLGQWQGRQGEHLSNPNLKSLREEIGILRILVEERFAACRSSTDLLLQAGPIGDLIQKIEKVVSSCNRLEASMGEHINKEQLLSFAQQIVQIIADNVTDTTTLDTIVNKIQGLLE